MIKQSILSPDEVEKMTLAEWKKYYSENELAISRQRWVDAYPQRVARWRNVHLFFILRKS
jgi:hypothetical protein